MAEECLCENITEGIEKDCENNVGGLRSPMWVTEKCNLNPANPYTISSPGDEISGINLVSGTYLHPFHFNKNTSNYTEVETNDETNGTTVTVQTITLILNRREKTKRDKLMLLSKFKDLIIVCRDSNGRLILFGQTEGVNLKTKEGGSGTVKADRNGYTITFVGEEPEEANDVTEAALTAALEP